MCFFFFIMEAYCVNYDSGTIISEFKDSYLATDDLYSYCYKQDY